MASAVASHFTFLLNGRSMHVDAATAQETLLEFIRGQGLTGSKEGCAEGECGACAVVSVGRHGDGSAYRVVNSCLLPLPVVDGHEIYTIESLAAPSEPAGLADAQRAMAAAGGSQCGYCTPGFVMSLFAEQYRRDRHGACDVMSMAGNLCRCTGYRPIRDAAAAVGPPPAGRFKNRLDEPPPRLESVHASGFARPSTVDECVAILASNPESTVIAGGSDLGVDWNLRGRRFTHLVSLEAIDELQAFSEQAGSITIGAALPLADIERRWTEAPAVVREWFELFASPPIRNRATLGGNLATASPIGDAAPLLAALDAVVHVAGAGGRRTVPLSSFFVGYRRTATRPGEIVTAIEIPKPLPQFTRFYKISKRRLDDISTVAAAMAMDWDDAGRVRRARFAFGGVAATPVRALEAEEAAVGQPWNEAGVRRVQQVLERTLSPIGDHRGSERYRREVCRSLVEKFWWERSA